MERMSYKSSTRVLMILAFSAAFVLFNSTMALAQTRGRGSDGYTRVLWIGYDSSVAMWKLDYNLNYVSGVTAGPYSGWMPIAFTVGDDNYSRLVWRSTTGELSLWLLDANLNYVSGYAYGPFLGWLPETTGVDSGGYEQLIWRHTLGYMAIWILSPDQSRVLVQAGYSNSGYIPGSEGIGEAMSDSPLGQGASVAHSLPKELTPNLRQLASAPTRIK
jgi:hypothetical protein